MAPPTPPSMDDVIGHAHARRLLARELTGSRRAHAYLFEGPRGVGKMTLARTFAAALLCAGRGDAPAPCGRCSSCARAAQGAHPFWHVFAPAPDEKVISIKALRDGAELERKIVLKPWGSPCTIISFDDAETLHPDAANWLLKFLEEPPPHVVFLLVTAVPRQLPVTVRSRCRRVRFGGLSRDDARRALERAAGIGGADADALLDLSDGSPGVALALREEDAAALARRLRDLFADLGRGRYGAALDTLVKEHGIKGAGTEERRKLRLVLEALAVEVAGTLRGAAPGGSPVAEWARRAGPDGARDALERLLEAQREVAMNANPPIVLEAVFGRLADAAGPIKNEVSVHGGAVTR